jgi:hypothetical protein
VLRSSLRRRDHDSSGSSGRRGSHSFAMALKMKQSMGAGQLVRARPCLPLGLGTRMAAVGVQQRFSRNSRIAQLMRAAAPEVETETFDVSWGPGVCAAGSWNPSSSSGNSTCTSSVQHALWGGQQAHHKCWCMLPCLKTNLVLEWVHRYSA